MKWFLITLILLDAATTHLAVGYFGAREILLVFVNQAPSAVWLVAAAKIFAVFYLSKMVRKYKWVRYILRAAVISHLFAIANNMCWLLLLLLYFP